MNHAHETARLAIDPAAPRDRSVAADLALLVVMLLAGPPGAFWVTLLIVLRRRSRVRGEACGLLPRVPALLPEAVPVRVPVEDPPRP